MYLRSFELNTHYAPGIWLLWASGKGVRNARWRKNCVNKFEIWTRPAFRENAIDSHAGSECQINMPYCGTLSTSIKRSWTQILSQFLVASRKTKIKQKKSEWNAIMYDMIVSHWIFLLKREAWTQNSSYESRACLTFIFLVKLVLCFCSV